MQGMSLLGRLQAGVLGLMVRALPPVTTALSVSACSGHEDGVVETIDDPDPPVPGVDTGVPADDPQRIMDACLPPNGLGKRLHLLVEGNGIQLKDETSVDGSVYLTAETVTRLNQETNATGGRIGIRIPEIAWDSVPREFKKLNPNEPVGILGLLTFPRLDAEFLLHENILAVGHGGTWGDYYAEQGFNYPDQVRFGLLSFIGDLHYDRDAVGNISNCVLDGTFGKNAPHGSAVVFYTPRADGGTAEAEANYNNEFVLILGAFEAVLPLSGEWATISGYADWAGAVNPSSMRIRLIANGD